MGWEEGECVLGLGVLAPFSDHYLYLGILCKLHRGCDSCVVSFLPLLVFYTVEEIPGDGHLTAATTFCYLEAPMLFF